MDLLTTITITKTQELIPSEEKNIKTNILKNSTLNKSFKYNKKHVLMVYYFSHGDFL